VAQVRYFSETNSFAVRPAAGATKLYATAGVDAASLILRDARIVAPTETQLTTDVAGWATREIDVTNRSVLMRHGIDPEFDFYIKAESQASSVLLPMAMGAMQGAGKGMGGWIQHKRNLKYMEEGGVQARRLADLQAINARALSKQEFDQRLQLAVNRSQTRTANEQHDAYTPSQDRSFIRFNRMMNSSRANDQLWTPDRSDEARIAGINDKGITNYREAQFAEHPLGTMYEVAPPPDYESVPTTERTQRYIGNPSNAGDGILPSVAEIKAMKIGRAHANNTASERPSVSGKSADEWIEMVDKQVAAEHADMAKNPKKEEEGEQETSFSRP